MPRFPIAVPGLFPLDTGYVFCRYISFVIIVPLLLVSLLFEKGSWPEICTLFCNVRFFKRFYFNFYFILTFCVYSGFTVGETGEGKVLGVLPFYHIYGMVVSQWCALHAGNTVVTLPRFQPQHFLSAIQTHRVSPHMMTRVALPFG